METETEDDFFKRGRQMARALERAAQDNPDLPVSFVAESLASLSEPREYATPFIPRSLPDEQGNRR